MQFHALSSSSFLLFSAYVFLHSNLAVGSHLQVIQTITVDKSGYYGNFKTIQEAINSVPDWNYQWIRVHVHQGVYIEQVIIPKEKQFILLEGHGTSTTVIQWNAYAVPGDSGINTAAFVVSSDNFIARKITFQNSYDYKSKQAVAVAAVVQGDKCSFYNCKFLSYQDTLCDYHGRHYFNNCWIEGGVDFIFGQAASIYEGCTLNSILLDKGPSWFTAHAKVNLSAPGGFVFKDCTLTGSGNMYLGRAWNQYATVLFYNTFISDIVVPLGWDSWQHDVESVSPQVPEVQVVNLDSSFYLARISKKILYNLNSYRIEFGLDGINLGRSFLLIAPQVPVGTWNREKGGIGLDSIGSGNAGTMEVPVRSQITYAEANCTGPGSDKGQRVPWEKQLSAQDWNKYLGHEFIDQERWIEHQAP